MGRPPVGMGRGPPLAADVMRRTSSSSSPSDSMRSSTPKRAAWSTISPQSTVSAGEGVAVRPSNAPASVALSRPRTVIS